MEHLMERAIMKSPVRAAVSGRRIPSVLGQVLGGISRIGLRPVVLCLLVLAACSPKQPSSQSSLASESDEAAKQAQPAAEARLGEDEARAHSLTRARPWLSITPMPAGQRDLARRA
jgi:hypothetical protein